jgi:hypothetical protein
VAAPSAVTAVQLDREAATVFYREVVTRYVDGLPRLGRFFVRALLPVIAGSDVLADPERAATTRPVFELRPVSPST